MKHLLHIKFTASRPFCTTKSPTSCSGQTLIIFIGIQMRYRLTLIILCALFKSLSAQSYLLPNEKLIISFKTFNEKKVVLAKDTSNKYIAYRFGTMEKIEFSFPENLSDSWKKFTYSYYLRGGGEENEGLDLNYLCFIFGKYKYVIYETYSAADDKTNCGIKIIDTRTNERTEIEGDPKSIEGSLIDFRNSELIQVGEELFD